MSKDKGKEKDDDNIFARRLDQLFSSITLPDGREYTYEEVQNGTQRAVTAAYIWRLRTGKARNPGYRVIKALSHFFGVSPGYFFTSDDQPEEMPNEAVNQNLADLFEDATLRQIALSASKMDEAGRQAILRILDYIVTMRFKS